MKKWVARMNSGGPSVIFAILFLLTLFSFEAYPQFDRLSQFERAKSSFKKGIHYFNRMHYLAAVEFFRKALIVYPDYYTAREYLARSYKLAGFVDEALKEWQALSDSTADNIALQYKIDTLRFRKVPGAHTLSSEFVLSDEFISNKLGRYRFPKPVDMAADGEKNIYITSFSTGKLVKIDANGEGVSLYSAGLQSKLFGIDVYKKKIAVSDFHNDTVYLMSLNFEKVKRIGKTGNGEGQFHGPEGISFDRKGNIFVVDSGNNRVQKFDPGGRFILAFGEYGDYEGQLKNPTDLTLYRQRVYVTDTGNKRLSCFDDYGNFIQNLSIDGLEKPRGISSGRKGLLISDEAKGLLFYDVENERAIWPEMWKGADRNFSRLIASIYDRDGFLYCLDYNYERIFVFSPIEAQYSNLDVEITSVDLNKYPVVALYAHVRNKQGNPVYGLKSKNFTVVEDGATISGIYVDYLKDKAVSASMVLCVDRSHGNRPNHNDIPWVAEFILKKMRKNDSIQLMNFNRDSWIGNNFDWSRRRTLHALKKRDYGSGKNIGLALYNSINNLLPRINRRAVILISDGEVTDESFQRYTVDNVIEFARSHHIAVHCITFKRASSPLRRIAEETGGFLLRANDIDELRSLYDRIRNMEEYRYVIVYYSFKMSDVKGWWSDLKLEVNYKGQRGIEWGGYFVPE
jgi:hypothetical protein